MKAVEGPHVRCLFGLKRVHRRQAARVVVAQATRLHADVLVLDATNILSRASSDARRLSHVPIGYSLKACFRDWVTYLVAAARPQVLIAIFDNPAAQQVRQARNTNYLRRRTHRSGVGRGSQTSNAAKLKPFIEVIKILDGLSFVSNASAEADDLIGAVNSVLCTDARVSLAVASGDSDMQQHIRGNISWIHMLPLPDIENPSGLVVVDEASFVHRLGFQPTMYRQYLALAGKKDCGIGGIGVGPATASRLLRQFGGIDGALEAADRGALRGWGAKVSTVLAADSSMRVKLRQNRSIFELPATEQHTLLSEDQMQQLRLVLRSKLQTQCDPLTTASKENTGLDAPLVWKHPLHAIRWICIHHLAEEVSRALVSQGHTCQLRAVTAEGLPVDVAVQLQSGERHNIMVCGECDFVPGGMNDLMQEGKVAHGFLSFKADMHYSKVLGKLNRAVQHHVRILRKTGHPPILIPWWHVKTTS